MACADSTFPVDGRGSGRGEGRHEQKGARGDGDCEPTRGADAASHRLSFLARHRAVNKGTSGNVSGTVNRSFTPNQEPFREISAKCGEKSSGMFRNVSEHASMRLWHRSLPSA